MSGLPGLAGGRLRDLNRIERGPLAKALTALNGDGEETRVVGGAVRDLALGYDAEDFDLASTAPPAEIIRRAEGAGFKVVPTGVEHGTVTIIVDGRAIETTTLREDIETDGRRAKVAYGRDFAEDARRRDFTINALSLDMAGCIHDPLDGLKDLAEGRVRFIGDANQRIREDNLRVLRFFRFSARFGNGALDPLGLRACERARAGLNSLSRERVRAELLKLIIAPHAPPVVSAMSDAGLLQPVLGGVGYIVRFRRMAEILQMRAQGDDPVLRLAALAVATVEDADRLRERLRLTKHEHRRLASAAAALAKLHGLEGPPTSADLKALLFRFGRTAVRDALTLAHAESDRQTTDPNFAEADNLLGNLAQPRLPIGGEDLKSLDLAPGPELGAVLRAFAELWIRAGFPEDRSKVDQLLVDAMRNRTQ